jgi:uncharacterized protein (DUF1810 family)
VTDPDLVRFIDAQAPVYAGVTAELTAGRKRTHWMWFVFPQLAGLAGSEMSRRYAISDLDQARRYLADPVLGTRLRDGVRLIVGHAGMTALAILGSPDDMKFRSCLTLFLAAAEDEADRALFSGALAQFYGGEPDPRTLDLLRAD